MAGNESLTQRIKAEFDARAQRQKAVEQEKASLTQEREKRVAQFATVCEDLKSVWKPRLDEFGKQFGDKIKVLPKIDPAQRQANVSFLTDMANVNLTLTVSLSSDLTKLVLDYDLLIVPMLFEYERHAKMETPLDKIDRDAVSKWIDDRLVACVKTYLSIQDNEHYRKRAMVEDPITKTRFMPEEAKAKLEHAGKTMYFASEESMTEYKINLQIDQPAAKAEPASAKPPVESAGTLTPTAA